MSAPSRRGARFLVTFGAVALLVAGVLAYFADPAPDGLDAVTERGCTTVQTPQGEQLHGHCIAQHKTDHVMAHSPLADYAVDGDDRWTGVAGVIGVLATAALAGGLFWVLRRRPEGR